MASDRRAFLLGTTSSALAIVDCRTPVLAAGDMIPAIDAHTHFFDPKRPGGVPWPNSQDKLLYRTVMPDDFRKVVDGLNVSGTIVVEASPWLEDNQWLLNLATKNPMILGVVGRLDVTTAEFSHHLRRFAKQPRFRGIRIAHADVKRAITDRAVLSRIGELSDHGLSLDVNGGPDLPADVSRLAERLPKLRIIINHAANVKVDGKPPAKDWIVGMASAAKQTTIYCKVSALVEATRSIRGDAPANVDFYRPELDTLWNLFGDDRLLYASNWPVCERAAPYSRVIAIPREYLAHSPRIRSEKFFTRNSMKAYAIG